MSLYEYVLHDMVHIIWIIGLHEYIFKNYSYEVPQSKIEFSIGGSLLPDPHFSLEIPPSENQ